MEVVGTSPSDVGVGRTRRTYVARVYNVRSTLRRATHAPGDCRRRSDGSPARSNGSSAWSKGSDLVKAVRRVIEGSSASQKGQTTVRRPIAHVIRVIRGFKGASGSKKAVGRFFKGQKAI